MLDHARVYYIDGAAASSVGNSDNFSQICIRIRIRVCFSKVLDNAFSVLHG